MDYMAVVEKIDGLRTAREAAAALEDRKGEDVVILDVRGLSGITDFIVMVTGTSTPHLKALFNAVHRALKTEGLHTYRRSGAPEDSWLVLDYIDVIIHIQSAAVRSYYAIEELWSEAPRIPLP
jgi:ribosome-associated protein